MSQWGKPQFGHGYTTFSVVPIFVVAFLMETPIVVDKAAWDQGALGPSRQLIIILHHKVGAGRQLRPNPEWTRVPRGSRVSNSVDL